MSPLKGLSKRDQAWMAYIDSEVAAVCDMKGWRRQIRRRWSARSKPLSRSRIDDYEWKMMPLRGDEAAPIADRPIEFDEGTYFVLRPVISKGIFILEHDTHHCGMMGDHWHTSTFTEIQLAAAGWVERQGLSGSMLRPPTSKDLRALPPEGLLRRFLLPLIDKFRPNVFSIT